MKNLLITLIATLTLIGCKSETTNDSNKAADKATSPKTVEPAKQTPGKDEAKAPGAESQANVAEKPAVAAVNESKKAAAPANCGANADPSSTATQGCVGAAQDVEKAKTDTPKGDSVKHYGAAFKTETVTSLDDVLAKVDEYNGKNVKISARISKVCKKKGCWFTLSSDKGDGVFVRVTMLNYGFFVPLDCDGKTAIVEGQFSKKDIPESARKHLAEDGGDNANKIKGAAMELRLVATGIDIKG